MEAEAGACVVNEQKPFLVLGGSDWNSLHEEMLAGQATPVTLTPVTLRLLFPPEPQVSVVVVGWSCLRDKFRQRLSDPKGRDRGPHLPIDLHQPPCHPSSLLASASHPAGTDGATAAGKRELLGTRAVHLIALYCCGVGLQCRADTHTCCSPWLRG